MRPSISTSGRKLAARAEVDVGATSHVDSGSWSDWTTTAYREPDCSWPRVRRGAWSQKTSPRTQRLHVAKHLHGLGAVCLVRSELLRFSANRRGGLSARGLDEGRPNRRRYGCPVPGQYSKRPRCILIGSEGDRVSHEHSVRQIVRHLLYCGLLPRSASAMKPPSDSIDGALESSAGSVALLADTIHNFSDALTAIPLWSILLHRKGFGPKATSSFRCLY